MRRKKSEMVCSYCKVKFTPTQFTRIGSKHNFCCGSHRLLWLKEEKPKEEQRLCDICRRFYPRREVKKNCRGKICIYCIAKRRKVISNASPTICRVG